MWSFSAFSRAAIKSTRHILPFVGAKRILTIWVTDSNIVIQDGQEVRNADARAFIIGCRDRMYQQMFAELFATM